MKPIRSKKCIAEMENFDNLSREALLWRIDSSGFTPGFCTLFRNHYQQLIVSHQ
jgi:hypothetical protein